jgi:hypothetical protein
MYSVRKYHLRGKLTLFLRSEKNGRTGIRDTNYFSSYNPFKVLLYLPVICA